MHSTPMPKETRNVITTSPVDNKLILPDMSKLVDAERASGLALASSLSGLCVRSAG